MGPMLCFLRHNFGVNLITPPGRNNNRNWKPKRAASAQAEPSAHFLLQSSQQFNSPFHRMSR
jgi:hypothetical protein